MPHEEHRADAPRRWLENAYADLALAKVALPPGGLYEHLCFHAHQAAEKSLKAVLIQIQVEFPYTRNIQALFDILPADMQIPSQLYEAVDLNPYAVSTRYPGEIEPVMESDYLEAIRLAETIIQWAADIIQKESFQ